MVLGPRKVPLKADIEERPWNIERRIMKTDENNNKIRRRKKGEGEEDDGDPDIRRIVCSS